MSFVKKCETAKLIVITNQLFEYESKTLHHSDFYS